MHSTSAMSSTSVSRGLKSRFVVAGFVLVSGEAVDGIAGKVRPSLPLSEAARGVHHKCHVQYVLVSQCRVQQLLLEALLCVSDVATSIV